MPQSLVGLPVMCKHLTLHMQGDLYSGYGGGADAMVIALACLGMPEPSAILAEDAAEVPLAPCRRVQALGTLEATLPQVLPALCAMLALAVSFLPSQHKTAIGLTAGSISAAGARALLEEFPLCFPVA